MSAQFFRNVKEPVDELSSFLGCSRVQTVLFSVICTLNFKNKTVDLEQMASTLGCSRITSSSYLNDIETLQKLNIVRRESEASKLTNISRVPAVSFSVNPDAFNALRKGMPIQKASGLPKDGFDLIKAISDIIRRCFEEEISFKEMWKEIARIESSCSSIRILKEVRHDVPDKRERAIFFKVCHDYFKGNIDTEPGHQIQLVTPDEKEQTELLFGMLNGTSDLMTNDLIEIRRSRFLGEIEIRLTKRSIQMLSLDNPRLSLDKMDEEKRVLISPAKIVKKNLVFSLQEREKLEFLTKMLMPDEYGKLIARLSKSGNKTGVAILMEGPPGTGKTESVLQLARQTGREILQVTISETKSKWFGDSERLIKEVFDNYRKVAAEASEVPILFFNEADGIFSARKQLGDSLVDQTENAIQNIILQELEDLEGILIATTNLTQNFDKAFERRFLYKIRFSRPTAKTRSAIWKDKIPSLTRKEALELSAKYEISGGNIDNVARKYMMAQVLSGKEPTIEQIESWCIEECPRQQYTRIGFNI